MKINFIDPDSYQKIINKYGYQIEMLTNEINQNQSYILQMNEYCEDYKTNISNLYKKVY